ncbi:SpaH/EbpB family LPXTG-anchored major pilin [Enterococcus devriesei]|uniref:SpaH/EbpB family LPXTG-anchored major pilin n=1 Tax=Enterococcus devriesei TaxID=319970 RepID=UPI00288D4C0D|nr:SpaH/EbpB family LPXTG-anchored major pilin [Enterococcus devriesei]MDT2821782.1 SpaH/EbpB family LPXTG-anchored major pilin [Enterococcus devriesei]
MMNKKFSFILLVLFLGLITSVAGGYPVSAETEGIPVSDINFHEKGSVTVHAVQNPSNSTVIPDISGNGTQQKLNDTEYANVGSGIKFSLMKISRSDAYKLGWSPSNKMKGQNLDIAKVDAYVNNVRDKVEETTDGNGEVTFDQTNFAPLGKLDTANPEANLFLIVQIGDLPAGVTSRPAPIIVNVPSQNPDYVKGNQNYYLYDVHLYPKFEQDTTEVYFKKVDEKGQALPGVEFVLRRNEPTGRGTDYLSESPAGNGPWVTNGELNFVSKSQENSPISKPYVFITGNDGMIRIQGLTQGHYRVEEKQNQSSENKNTFLPNKKVIDFTIDDNDLKNNVKKDILNGGTFINYDKPKIAKTIQKNSSHRDEIVKFTLEHTIPGDIQNYGKYIVKDTLDSRLNFVSTSKVITIKGTDIKLAEGTDFILTEGNALVWKFTDKGLANLAKAYKQGARKLVIPFNAHLNGTSKADEVVPNQGHLEYKNDYDQDGDVTTNEVYDVYGGVKFEKSDRHDSSVKLGGAKFIVSNRVDGVTKYLDVDDQGGWTWVDAKDRERAKVFVTDAQGRFDIIGLDFSKKIRIENNKDTLIPIEDGQTVNNYALEEVEAPKGYAKLAAPLEFKVTPGFETNKILIIENAKEAEIPLTGSVTSNLLIIVGIILLSTGFIIYKRSKKI